MISLESPHRGDSNENTQHVIINIKKKITLNYPKYNNVCSYGIFFPKRLKNEFKTAVVNKPSVFEPLKFYRSIQILFGKKIIPWKMFTITTNQYNLRLIDI